MEQFLIVLLGCFIGSLGGTAAYRRWNSRNPPSLLDARRFNLQPGDELVITSQRSLSRDEIDQIVDQIKERFPGHKVIVLCGGLALSIRSSAAPDPERPSPMQRSV